MSDTSGGDPSDAGETNGSEQGGVDGELPKRIVDEAERLTRLARSVADDEEATLYRERRSRVLARYGFTARVRSETTDRGAVLVLHPEEWHDGDVIRTDRIEDVSRALEIPLEGPGDPESWGELDATNRELVSEVRAHYGDVHGDNARVFADFMGNHYAKPIESATRDEIEEFLTEYFVRNAWPSARQRAVIEESIELVFETAGEPVPEFDAS